MAMMVASATFLVEYSIDYHDTDGEAFQIRLIYKPEPEPELRLANHDEVWKPAGPIDGGTENGN